MKMNYEAFRNTFKDYPVFSKIEIKKHFPTFTISYKPDYRQTIAETWPQTIDDSTARNDWGWKHEFDLPSMVKEMLEHVGEKKKKVVI